MYRLQLVCLASLVSIGLLACKSGESDGDPNGAAGFGGGGGASGQDGTSGSSAAGAGASGTSGPAGNAGAVGGNGAAGVESDAGGADASVDTDAATECNQDEPYKCSVCDNDVNCMSATYFDNADGTVTSGCCDLVWQQAADPGLYNEDEAKTYCAGIGLAGATWRVPTLPELMSLVVLGNGDPTIDTVAFPNTPAVEFWSSTKHADGMSNPWNVNFSGGTLSTTSFDIRYEYHVRCVH